MKRPLPVLASVCRVLFVHDQAAYDEAGIESHMIRVICDAELLYHLIDKGENHCESLVSTLNVVGSPSLTSI